MPSWMTRQTVGLLAQVVGLLGALFILALFLEWISAGAALFGGLSAMLLGGTLWRLRDRLA